MSNQFQRAKQRFEDQYQKLEECKQNAVKGFIIMDGDIDNSTIRQRTNEYINNIFSARDIRQLPPAIVNDAKIISEQLGTENVEQVVEHLLSDNIADSLDLHENPGQETGDLTQLRSLYTQQKQLEKDTVTFDKETAQLHAEKGYVNEQLTNNLSRAEKSAKMKGQENPSQKETLENYLRDTLDSIYKEKPSLFERAKRMVGNGSPPKTMSQTAMEMYNSESIQELPIPSAYKDLLLEEFGDDPKAVTKHLLEDPQRASIIQGFEGGHNGMNKEAVTTLESLEQVKLIEQVRPIEDALEEGPQVELPIDRQQSDEMENTLGQDPEPER